jgi:hypothetical protein
MKKRLLIAATAVSLLGVLGQGVADAHPGPTFTVACPIGSNTTVDWVHVKLSQVTFHWLAPVGNTTTTFQDVTVPITAKAPHGSAFSTTPPAGLDNVNPASVVVSLTHADGSGTDTALGFCR